MEENNKAYTYLIRILTKRDYSEYKLRQKLKEKGFEEFDAEEAISLVKEKNYLREDYYIEARVKGLMHKGNSPTYIQNKLREEMLDVSTELILDIFKENHQTIEEQIKYLANKKLRSSVGKDPYKAREKALAYVIGKGHNYSESKHIIDSMITD